MKNTLVNLLNNLGSVVVVLVVVVSRNVSGSAMQYEGIRYGH